MKTKILYFLIVLCFSGCAEQNVTEDAGEQNVFETANCYIVTQSGTYSFPAVKGNSDEPVGLVASAEVLWESFGTERHPFVGDLIEDVSYSDGIIKYVIPHDFREGNAVIVAKDKAGVILWSWHIWLTNEPKEVIVGARGPIMMDRNLGATKELRGLHYQWGRKDPMIGTAYSTIRINYPAYSRGDYRKFHSDVCWNVVESDAVTGTIEYAIAHPTTVILPNPHNGDWCYSIKKEWEPADYASRWTTLRIGKSIYDPCPAGWRVPDIDTWERSKCCKQEERSWKDDYFNEWCGLELLGYFDYQQCAYKGSRGDDKEGYYWSVADEAHPKHLDSKAPYLNIEQSWDQYETYFWKGGSMRKMERGTCLPVRCFKEPKGSQPR